MDTETLKAIVEIFGTATTYGFWGFTVYLLVVFVFKIGFIGLIIYAIAKRIITIFSKLVENHSFISRIASSSGYNLPLSKEEKTSIIEKIERE